MRLSLSLALLAATTLPALAQDPDSTNRAPAGPGNGRASGPRPYERVITADAKTRRGLVSVHRVGDRPLFEIRARD